MKYKLISVFVVGLLAAGLYTEAASVETGSGSAVSIEDTKDNIEDTQDNIVDRMTSPTAGEASAQAAAQETLDLYGGIRASLDWNSIPYLDVPEQAAPLTGSIGAAVVPMTQAGVTAGEEAVVQDGNVAQEGAAEGSVAQELTPGDADEAEHHRGKDLSRRGGADFRDDGWRGRRMVPHCLRQCGGIY